MHLIRLTRSSRPLFRRGYRVLYGETHAACPHFLAASVPGDRNDEIKRGEMKKRFCFAIPLSSRQQYLLSNTAHDAFVYHNDILILLLFTNKFSRFYRKKQQRWNQTRRTARVGNIKSTRFIWRVNFDVFVVRTFGLKSDRLQIKTKKIIGHKTHVGEI